MPLTSPTVKSISSVAVVCSPTQQSDKLVYLLCCSQHFYFLSLRDTCTSTKSTYLTVVGFVTKCHIREIWISVVILCTFIDACLCIYTVSGKKRGHFIFNYNSRIFWSIFIIFVPLETGVNT